MKWQQCSVYRHGGKARNKVMWVSVRTVALEVAEHLKDILKEKLAGKGKLRYGKEGSQGSNSD